MSLLKSGKKALGSDLRSEAIKVGGLGIEVPREITNEDNALVKDFIAGNDAAFTQLVTKYKDALTNYLNMMVGNYDIAVDLCQETFLRVYKNILRYSHIYQFSTWIYRIATNLAIDEIRYRKGRGRVFYRNVWGSRGSEEQAGVEFELPDKRMGPSEEILRKESGQVVGDAIRSLPEKYRTAFVLKEIQEMSYEGIAQILKCSTGTIKSRLHRARELLQRKLEHYV
jgi:RNA polymerase sigma-70 factor (ECF subfamily)